MRTTIRALIGAAVLAVISAAVLTTAAAPASASAASAATLAANDIGKTAGTCATKPTTNYLGGSQFEHSCSGGYSGGPEYWCADFAEWVWANSGLNTSGITAAAQSFLTYGESNGTLHAAAQPGDAVTFSGSAGGYADHVGVVTTVNADGSFVLANGDWDGVGGQGMAHFAVTSSVVQTTVPASEATVGSYVGVEGYYMTGIIGPSGSGGGSAPPSTGGNTYTPAGICGTGYGVIDSHRLTGATIYLMYDDANGNNCVTTLADSDQGAQSMNATLTVQDGATGSDPGSYHWYAGPVTEHAPDSCVKWGGTYKTSTWTSDYSHCGDGDGSPAPGTSNPYTPDQACGSGYGVVDHHDLTGATVYLLYSDTTGDNCVVTMATDISGAAAMNATLGVEGGASGSNPGTFTYYAGPVYEHAPSSCVKFGGTYKTSTWTSAYGHCGSSSGSGAANPYTAAGVCGSGYSVIDSHDLGGATVYLLYDAGNNCVVTLNHSGSSAAGLNATLQVQGGGSGSNPGVFQYYAGPVRLAAASACVKWGGTYQSTTWTSAWSHCG